MTPPLDTLQAIWDRFDEDRARALEADAEGICGHSNRAFKAAYARRDEALLAAGFKVPEVG